MKIGFVIITVIMLQLTYLTVSAQVKVTGHATAEVVESVSAQNSLNNHISIEGSSTSIGLGSIRLSGAINSAYDVQVNNTVITNGTNSYSIETGYNETTANNDVKTKDITLSAMIDNKIMDGDYDGRLTVIVSYN